MPVHWPLYYTRGIANERAGNWPAAEADFREALKLEPDQPLVLNYLGYSMVEKQREPRRGARHDRAGASKAEPDDGYITDSLGWVLYRLGRYEEAVKPMLRAVELTPDDPVINDHLGDVLWMVGRKREAEFQWRRALSASARPTTSTWTASARSSRSASTRCSPTSRSRTAEAGVTGRRRRSSRPPRSTSRCTSPAAAPTATTCSTASWSSPASATSSRPSPPPASRSPSTAPSPATSAPAPTTSSSAPRALLGRRPRRRAPPDEVAPGRQRHRRRLRRRRRDAPPARPALAACRSRRPRRVLALGADLPVCLAGRRLPHVRHRRAPRRRSRCRPSGWCSPTPASRSPTAAVFAGLAAPRQPAAPRAAGLRRRRRRSSPGSPPSATTSSRPPSPSPRRSPTPLAALAAQPGCRLARMSGSGATCFGLFAAEPQPRRRRAARRPLVGRRRVRLRPPLVRSPPAPGRRSSSKSDAGLVAINVPSGARARQATRATTKSASVLQHGRASRRPAAAPAPPRPRRLRRARSSQRALEAAVPRHQRQRLLEVALALVALADHPRPERPLRPARPPPAPGSPAASSCARGSRRRCSCRGSRSPRHSRAGRRRSGSAIPSASP